MLSEINTHGTDEMRRRDLIVYFVLGLYCLSFGIMRLLVSSAMELDEAEQYLAGEVLRWGYVSQPPLYSWLVYIVSTMAGMELWVLVALKYGVLFCFYVAVYRTGRELWSDERALLVVGALMLVPVYLYEFNRDLSHTILVSLLSAVTVLLFIRLLRDQRPRDYLFIGIAAGLGILSKYNYGIVVLAVLGAGLACPQGRKVLFSRWTLVSALAASVIVLPHLLWLVDARFPSVQFAMKQARAGGNLFTAKGAAMMLGAYSGVLIAAAVCGLFFFRDLGKPRQGNHVGSRPVLLLAGFGLVLPLFVVLLLKAGAFQGRWLAPVLFLVPLAIFTLADSPPRPHVRKGFLALCATLAVAVFVVRAFIGFFPDLAGKVERIHIPYRALAAQLLEEAARQGNAGPVLSIVTDDDYLYANLKQWLPEARRAPLREPAAGSLIVWNATKQSEKLPEKYRIGFPTAETLSSLKAPYLRSSSNPPFSLGIAVVR